ncbi:hypothetical protein LIA77_00066 [Sarocladium implicatum]|nr:hypothetical protein LIA77_00066 [Sarocladium implicatum]
MQRETLQQLPRRYLQYHKRYFSAWSRSTIERGWVSPTLVPTPSESPGHPPGQSYFCSRYFPHDDGCDCPQSTLPSCGRSTSRQHHPSLQPCCSLKSS